MRYFIVFVMRGLPVVRSGKPPGCAQGNPQGAHRETPFSTLFSLCAGFGQRRMSAFLCAKKALILEVEIWKFFQKVTNQIPAFSKSFQKFCHLIGRRRRHRETVAFVLYSSFSLWSINLFAVLHIWIREL